jgi:hypothetical protein
MKKLSTAALVVLAFSGPALAAPSCTGWMAQSDGSEWRTCVDDDGRQYCERKYNGYITRVSCS